MVLLLPYSWSEQIFKTKELSFKKLVIAQCSQPFWIPMYEVEFTVVLLLLLNTSLLQPLGEVCEANVYLPHFCQGSCWWKLRLQYYWFIEQLQNCRCNWSYCWICWWPKINACWKALWKKTVNDFKDFPTIKLQINEILAF